MTAKFEMYDSAFLGILQNEGNIVGFLDAFFSFLYRRTDFYRIMTTSTDKMGFPAGVARKHLLTAYKQYETRAREDDERRRKLNELKTSETTPPSAESDLSTACVPPASRVEEVLTSDTSLTVSDNSSTLPTTRSTSLSDTSAVVDISPSSPTSHHTSTPAVPAPPGHHAPSAGSNKTIDDDDDDPQLTSQQKQFQLNADSYNGAVRDNYSWSQSISDVDIHVQVPDDVRRGADVVVEICRKRLHVSYRVRGSELVDAVFGELTWDVNVGESMWTLEPGQHVHINLEKVQERWWDAVLVDEPKISVRKIDASRPITDLDDEAQAKVEELMYNEHQKRLGLPQSHEKKVHDMLRQAWDVEGSPFKGQPFDPSIVNVTPGN